MTIFDKIEAAIGNYTDHPRKRQIVALFAVAAIGAGAAFTGYAGQERIVDHADLQKSDKGKTLLNACMKEKEKSFRAIMAPTQITIGPAFTSIAHEDCLNDPALKEKLVQDDMDYRSDALLTGVGLCFAVIGGLGAAGGAALRGIRALKR